MDPTASGDDEDASDLFVSGPIHTGACVWKLPGSRLRELELNLRWLPAPPEMPQLAYGTAGGSVFDKPEPRFIPGVGDTANYEARESLPGFGGVMFSLQRGRIVASLSGKLSQADLARLAGIVAKRL